MNTGDPLADLHPLREPALIGWWPPAPGWWALSLCALLSAVLLAWLLHRRYRGNRYRRRALSQLALLHAQYRASGDTDFYLAQVNALLKSIALLAYPNAGLASRHGEAWRDFLNASLPADVRLQSAFDDAVYQKSCPGIDVDRVHRAAAHWIRHHGTAP